MKRGRMKRAVVALLTCLAACTTQTGPGGRFTGTVTPANAGPLCPSSHAYLQIHDGHVIFAPDEGTWVLEGSAGPAGDVTADKSRVAQNNQIYDTTFTGRLSMDSITGTYTTPRCSFTVTLTRR